jgi:HEPN domain-containing protein
MMPNTASDWISAGEERSKDATILRDQGRSLAAVYMAGYGLECRLKAYLSSRGKRFPAHGSAGHNLLGLWEACGFKLSDVYGARRAFLERWNTALRYEVEIGDFQTLIAGAISLTGYIQKSVRRAKH